MSDRCGKCEKVKELQETIKNLRISRRVLMGLIERMQNDQNHALTLLQTENKKLKRENIKIRQTKGNTRRDREVYR